MPKRGSLPIKKLLEKWLEATDFRRSGFCRGFILAEPQIARFLMFAAEVV
jgi:hypothetical protein